MTFKWNQVKSAGASVSADLQDKQRATLSAKVPSPLPATHARSHAQTQLPDFTRIPDYTLQTDVFILILDSLRNVGFVYVRARGGRPL